MGPGKKERRRAVFDFKTLRNDEWLLHLQINAIYSVRPRREKTSAGTVPRESETEYSPAFTALPK